MAKKISKQEAVRRALKHFGNDAKPLQMQPWIKQELGIDMTTDHISTAKGDALRAARKAKAAKKAAATQPAAVPQRAAAKADAAPASRKPTAVPLDDILYIKELVRRVEPAAVKTLIDAFTK
jgi:septum formation inhibitor MinC